MGQILVIQDSGEVGLSLNQYAIVRANGLEELRAALHGVRFEAAVAVQRAETEQVFDALQAVDPDLGVVLIAASDRVPQPVNQAEVLTIPFAPDALQNAVKRAMRRTELEREVKSLRAQLGGVPQVPGVTDGNGHSAHLGWIRSLPPRFDLRELLSNVEKTVILRTLEATKGAQAEAARRLGLSRSDLSYKLAKYELRKPVSERSAGSN